MMDKTTTRRYRRTRAEVEALKALIYKFAAEHRPVTVRQLFYLLVSCGAIEKTEAEYQNVVIRLVGEMRETGELPWAWITDSTRLVRKPASYSSMADAA